MPGSSVHVRAAGPGAAGCWRRNVPVVFRPTRMRLTLQLAAGSVAVHELRYRLGPGHGERSLSDHGHGYLTLLIPLLGLLLAVAVAHFVWLLCTRRPESLAAGRRISVRALAPALLGLHVGQEAIEGVLAFGRPLEVATVLHDGGWIAVPLCGLVAGIISWLTRGARRLARAVLDRRSVPPVADPPSALPATPFFPAGPSAPLARHGAERAPPFLAS